MIMLIGIFLLFDDIDYLTKKILGFSTVYIEKVRVLGEMVFLNSSLYFFSAFPGFGERLFHRLFLAALVA
jgi:hypothetical protein